MCLVFFFCVNMFIRVRNNCRMTIAIFAISCQVKRKKLSCGYSIITSRSNFFIQLLCKHTIVTSRVTKLLFVKIIY